MRAPEHSVESREVAQPWPKDIFLQWLMRTPPPCNSGIIGI